MEIRSLVRNENYWGQKPYFGNLVIRTISDDTTRAMALETGEVDYVIGVQASQVDYLQSTVLQVIGVLQFRRAFHIVLVCHRDNAVSGSSGNAVGNVDHALQVNGIAQRLTDADISQPVDFYRVDCR